MSSSEIPATVFIKPTDFDNVASQLKASNLARSVESARLHALTLTNDRIEALEQKAKDLARFVETTRQHALLQSDRKTEALEQKARDLADFVETLQNQTRLQSETEIEALGKKARDLAQFVETVRKETRLQSETEIAALGQKAQDLAVSVEAARAACLTQTAEEIEALGKKARELAVTVETGREQALGDSEARFRQLANSMPAMIWSSLPDGYVDYYNLRWYEYTGLPDGGDEGGDQSWFAVLHPDDAQTCHDIWNASIRSGQPYELEIRFKEFKSGEYRWHLAKGVPLKNMDGTIVRWYGTLTDIHIQRLAEESDRHLAAIVESSQDAIISKTLTGIVLTWNKAAQTIYGYTAEEIVGHSVEKLLEPNQLDELHLILSTLGKGTSIRNLVTTKRRKDGATITVSLSISPILNGTGGITAICVVARDISEQRLLEEKLRQSSKMDGIGCLAGGVAHDFNNLLTVINGRSQLMMNRFKPGDKTRTDLELIYKTGERAASLTRQLLAFSRQQVLQSVVLDLNAVTGDMDKLLRRLIPESIELETVLSPTLGRVKADPGQIEQVIMNLIVNARDAMPDGGRIIVETSNVELGEDYCNSHADVLPGLYSMLAVTDTGHGMDAAVKARIFEPFYTTKPQGKGTGLGLATVFGVVKQSKGHLEVYSEVDKGTTFKIYLPQTNEVEKNAVNESGAVRAIGREVVLIVEDQKGVRELVRDLLEMNGYVALMANNGTQALKILETEIDNVKLLITDVVMPEMGGPELCERIKVLNPKVKVLFTSGYTDHAIVRNGTLEASDDFIQKPFTPVKFALKVREVLDRKPQASDLDALVSAKKDL